MLCELRIKNFAIIDNLELQFGSGLITFTGETGAGKSIIIDAVEAILGGRVDSTMVRADTERATVEAEFRIPENLQTPLHEILSREELLDDPNYVTLGREIRLQGRHIARLNGRTVSVSLLREVGEYLVDVHGQSEHLSLFRVREHLRLLDNLAGVNDPLYRYRKTFSRLREVRRDLGNLRQNERDAARRADLLSYQIDEIESAGLEAGDDVELKQEESRLANAESLASLTQEALFNLDEGDPETQAITDLLGQVVEGLRSIAKTDASQQKLHEQAQSAFDTLTELTLELRDYQENIEFNPHRLEEVETRLDLIQSLKRKYGGTIEEINAFAAAASEQLDEITHAEERISALEKEERKLLTDIVEQGEALSVGRHKASDSLSSAVEAELNHLKMEGARFGVDFQYRLDPQGVLLTSGERVAFDANGLETVQFLVAPNPGEGLKPLAKIASGGEMSRLMLALKNVLARADLTPTLIFDEIDQGIGGRIGAVVGEKLWNLSREHQVLCITHLPQLAAFGGQHYRVQKHVDGGRTSTIVEMLQGDVRVNELAQMLGEVSEGTLQSAREILDGVEQRVKQ